MKERFYFYDGVHPCRPKLRMKARPDFGGWLVYDLFGEPICLIKNPKS